MEVIDNVISAYEAVKMNGVSQGIIALCSFIRRYHRDTKVRDGLERGL